MPHPSKEMIRSIVAHHDVSQLLECQKNFTDMLPTLAEESQGEIREILELITEVLHERDDNGPSTVR